MRKVSVLTVACHNVLSFLTSSIGTLCFDPISKPINTVHDCTMQNVSLMRVEYQNECNISVKLAFRQNSDILKVMALNPQPDPHTPSFHIPRQPL